jgi:hypothetical protein
MLLVDSALRQHLARWVGGLAYGMKCVLCCWLPDRASGAAGGALPAGSVCAASSVPATGLSLRSPGRAQIFPLTAGLEIWVPASPALACTRGVKHLARPAGRCAVAFLAALGD